ncbi:MAG TPA: hypothetical protein VHB47_22645 [Thermoanaerobaculia bacterium]|jgi:hypothetical protein|nr:hypothetical protein [Thermoanaerobaculia bacterium]
MKTRLAVAALLALSAMIPAGGVALAAAPPPLSKLPVLAYVRTGGFPPVPAVAHLLVYSTGEAILTKFPANFGYCEATASADQISELQARLAAAGAFYLGDDVSTPVADEQDHTLTFFVPVGGKGRARSNTFSYISAMPGPYLEVEKAVESFIAEVFPHC